MPDGGVYRGEVFIPQRGISDGHTSRFFDFFWLQPTMPQVRYKMDNRKSRGGHCTGENIKKEAVLKLATVFFKLKPAHRLRIKWKPMAVRRRSWAASGPARQNTTSSAKHLKCMNQVSTFCDVLAVYCKAIMSSNNICTDVTTFFRRTHNKAVLLQRVVIKLFFFNRIGGEL